MASVVLEGEFTATGQSSWVELRSDFNLSIKGGQGTVQVERSFDGGTTVFVVSKNTDGDPASYTLNNNSVSLQGIEPESKVSYRFNCTAYTAGTIPYRLSQ